MTNASQFFTGAFPPGAQFELITVSGTWTHPQPGVAYNALIIAIGGGGAGGNSGGGNYGTGGTAGTAGGATVFGALATANGGSVGGNGTQQLATNTGAVGGNGGGGGFGGGGGSGYGAGSLSGFAVLPVVPGVGGPGFDYIGGGGGCGYGVASPGSSAAGIVAQNGNVASVGGTSTPSGGWPNGAPFSNYGVPALGGFPGLLFDWAKGFGAGGAGALPSGSTATSGTASTLLGGGGGGGSGRIVIAQTATLTANQTVTIGAGGTAGSGATGANGAAGQPGCVGIWYWPVRGTAEL